MKRCCSDALICWIYLETASVYCAACCCFQVGTIQSPALVKALFDIYVGSDPVSSDAKRSIGKGLAALLNE
jgi:hypothetical protein